MLALQLRTPSYSIFTIPSQVKFIVDNAFDNCSSITVVFIPTTVTRIGSYAFAYSSLKFISIPTSLSSISDHAFASSALFSIAIPTSVSSISESAFEYCVFDKLHHYSYLNDYHIFICLFLLHFLVFYLHHINFYNK
mmetsp:Transcript_269/g.418  ORF Transcript_269/g.418 Transcript_269/m.418 type:complete len:137 (-) Transcript_269:11-421(-)